MAVILYSTDCPKCKVLKSKLDQKKIQYNIINDLGVMLSKGFSSAPQLEVNNKVFEFNQARKLVDSFDNSNTFEQYITSMENE